MERGLTALDSLYELRNVIPLLLTSSGFPSNDGKCLLSLRKLVDVRKHGMLSGSHPYS